MLVARRFGGAHFWSFGAFPVVVAALFQLAVIYHARSELGAFFYLQSLVAVSLSVSSLQPRTWNAADRVPERLRWTLCLSLLTICVFGAYFASNPPSIGFIIFVFLSKKVCDVCREFFFMSGSRLIGWANAPIAILEMLGVAAIVVGYLEVALAVYLLAGVTLVLFAMKPGIRGGHALNWMWRELPHALVMTMFNMGSRLFLILVPAPSAHLVIGSLLQVVNFMSPIVFALNSKRRTAGAFVAGCFGLAAIVAAGAFLFFAYGGGSVSWWWLIVVLGTVLTFNSSAMVRFSSGAETRLRNRLGLLIAIWVALASLLAFSDILPWQLSYGIFLFVNSLIISVFMVRHWR